MTRKIGEIFELDGEWYQCIESDSCGECSFFTTECGSGTKSDLADKVAGLCSKVRRIDNKHAIFKKLEKVGEHYKNNDRTYQLYKLPLNIEKLPSHTEGITLVRFDLVEIEIKEDMEEKKTNFIEKLEALCKRYNMSDGVCADFISEVKEIIKDKEECNFKPFNLEEAKAGKPVCTRDGRKARIICFDRVGDFPIVALTDDRDYKEEGVNLYDINGKGSNECFDLMMIPEKKERWINIYRNKKGEYWSEMIMFSTKKDAIDFVHDNAQYVKTVKVEWED